MEFQAIFEDRADAGRRLSQLLLEYKSPNVIVLAIPRGGVVVGWEVANALRAPLDVVIPRKIGAPSEPELAIGAVAEHVEVIDEDSVRYLGVSEKYIREETVRQREEIERRKALYRHGRPPLDVQGKTVLLVDDGIATGYTTIAAARELRLMQPGRLVLAVPVAPPEAVRRLRQEVDELIVIETPEPFMAVGAWYADFGQTTDEEVVELLHRAVWS